MAAITKTNAGLNALRDALDGVQFPQITYVAFGTSSTTPTAGDTQLGNETFRKAVTSYTNVTTGEILINCYLAPGDLVGTNIQEVGFFGTGQANSNANTGVLFAHGLYSHTKLNTESIQFQLDWAMA